MDFLTTKQVAQAWEITPKRVTVLAGQGRIPGAKRVGGRWLIPEDAAKPADPRKQKAPRDGGGRYLFPFPLCVVTSQEQVDGFTADQKELYHLDLLFEKGSFPEARDLAEKLLPSKDRYVRIGALYLLPLICFSLHDFEAMEQYSTLFRAICQEEETHKADVGSLLIELNGETSSFSQFIKDVDELDVRKCSPEILPFVSAYKLLALVAKFGTEGIRQDVSPYEVLCRELERQGCFYNLIFLHFYLSLYYSFSQDKDSELEHLRLAFDIAIRHDAIYTLSFLSSFSQGSVKLILKDYPPSYVERIVALSEGNMDARSTCSNYLGKKAMLAQLDEDDRALLSACVSNRSIEQMAQEFGLTRSGVNKRLSRLYAKLGVSSKKELGKKFLNSVLDWN